MTVTWQAEKEKLPFNKGNFGYLSSKGCVTTRKSAKFHQQLTRNVIMLEYCFNDPQHRSKLPETEISLSDVCNSS